MWSSANIDRCQIQQSIKHQHKKHPAVNQEHLIQYVELSIVMEHGCEKSLDGSRLELQQLL